MKTKIVDPHKSSLGMDANILVLILYILGAAATGWAFIPYVGFLGYAAWVLPVVVFFLEKESSFVKFNAVNVICIGVVRIVLSILFGIIKFILEIIYTASYSYSFYSIYRGGRFVVNRLSDVIGLAFIALFIYLIVASLSYKQVELPIIGSFANKACDKMKDININTTANTAPPAPPPPAAEPAPAEEPAPEAPDNE